MRLYIFLFILVMISSETRAQDYRRWEINEDGSISWRIKGDIPHNDHFEMSGRRISAVLRYGVDDKGDFSMTRTLVWPMLRTIPNNTHASLTRTFTMDALDLVIANRKPLPPEKTISITLDGTMKVESMAGNDLQLTRQCFPSMFDSDFHEVFVIRNLSDKEYKIEIPGYSTVYTTDPADGVESSW